jgi:methionine biosynthesis protein MetW
MESYCKKSIIHLLRTPLGESMMQENDSRSIILDDYWKRIIERGNDVHRLEFDTIVDWIEPKTKIMDFGCGDGTLGKKLINKKNCEVYGIDISKIAVRSAIEKGLIAEKGDLDKTTNYPENHFDYIILCDVLEHVFDPLTVLREALRIGLRVIVSFPNFAMLPARLELITGHFPKSPLFGYNWYDTQHIHMFSISDFNILTKKLNVMINKKEFLTTRPRFLPFMIRKKIAGFWPNLLSAIAIFELAKK